MADPNTLERELSSLYCFYDALENNRNPTITDTLDLKFVDDVIKGIWTKQKEKDIKDHDMFAYQYHGSALKSHLQGMGAPSSGWKYGIFEKETTKLTSQSGVNMSTTNIMDDIWKLFDNKHRNLFSGSAVGQKDSWNPADVYLFKGNESVVIKKLKALKEKTEEAEQPVVFVSLVNDYLKRLYNQKKLIGVSLKAAKMPNAPQAKAFNTVVDDDFEAPKFGEAKIIKGSNGFVHQYMELSKKKGNLDFKGNSITFECEVSMDGGKPLRYFWESKSPPISRPHVTEMKDMVTGTRKNTLAKANARGGSINKDLQFEPLIKEFTGKGWNHKVPTKVIKWDKSDPPPEITRLVKYWSAIYLTLEKSPIVTLNDVKIKNDKGKEVVVNGTREGTMAYFYDLFWIDGHSSKDVQAAYGLPRSPKYTQNFRGKLRGLNIIRAVVNANNKKRLGEFLVRAYYAAGKIQFSVDDLQGPFVKIQ